MREHRHQILTPINHIIGYCELLLEEASEHKIVPVPWAPELQRIRADGERLSRLVGDAMEPEVKTNGALANKRSHREMIATLASIVTAARSAHSRATEAQCNEVASDLLRILVASEHLLMLISSPSGLTGHQMNIELPIPGSVDPSTTPFSGIADIAAERHAGSVPAVIPPSTVLVVDDNEGNRNLLKRRLDRMEHTAVMAEDGLDALQTLRRIPVDLILLDILMPNMTGYQVLEHLKADPNLQQIPVIMLSAIDDLESVVRCIELGADDYLPKPFPPPLLHARIGACLDRKHLRDQEARYLRQIETERARVDELLHVILPDSIIDEITRTGMVLPKRHENVAVLFCDIVGFTEYCDHREPHMVVSELQVLIEAYEELAVRYGVQKIKTVGDAFMAVAGLLAPVENPVFACVQAGLEMLTAARTLSPGWNVRVGIHIGPVVAGVLGKRQYLFDLWGDTVNMAARVESHCPPSSVALSRKAWEQVEQRCDAASLGTVRMKGKGDQEIFRVISISVP